MATMRRSALSSSQHHTYRPPPQPPIPSSKMGSVAIDSSDPTIGDILYRLDDQQNEEHRRNENAHPQTQPENPADGGSPPEPDGHPAWSQARPWWRSPSPYWLMPIIAILAIASGSVISSKVELFTQIVCEEKMGLEAFADILRFLHERPPMSSACRTESIIAASADLQMKITICMGLLSVLTTGWWSALSDRRGRTTVLLCAVSGLVTSDLSLLVVGLMPVAKIPFGTHFMLLSPIIEGLLGGSATIIAANQAYISDSTPAGTRARIYAQTTGIFYVGYVFGPALGGYMARATDSLMSTVVFATSAHSLYLLLLAFFVPESVSPDRKREAMAAYKAGLDGKHADLPASGAEEHGEAGAMHASNSPQSTWIQWWTRRALMPLRPMMMLLPRDVDEIERLQSRSTTTMPSIAELRTAGSAQPATYPAASSSHISVSHISCKRKRDWNLFWLSLSYAFSMSCMSVMTPKALYAQEYFGWGPGQLGLYLTTVSIARVLALTCVLPVVIKVWHRPPKSLSLPQDSSKIVSSETVALLDDEGRLARRKSSALSSSTYLATSTCTPARIIMRDVVTASEGRETAGYGSSNSVQNRGNEEDDDDQGLYASEHRASVEELWTLRAKHLRMIHDSHFDLKLTRLSFLCDCLCYLLLCFVPGPTIFVTASVLLSIGSGASASMSSLALAFLYRPTEAGNLFGAWSIVSALSSTVIGPFFFTWVFRTGPHNIFYAGEALLLAAFACTLMIRVRKPRSLPTLPSRTTSRKPSFAPG